MRRIQQCWLVFDVILMYSFRIDFLLLKVHIFVMIQNVLAYKEKDLIEATQIAQDAQAGYACDYCNKRQRRVGRRSQFLGS